MRNDRGRAGAGMPAMAATRPSTDLSGPLGGRWTGCLEDYERDRLGFLLDVRERFGALARFDDNTTIVSAFAEAAQVLGRHDEFAILGNFRNERISIDEAASTIDIRRYLNAPLRAAMVGPLADLTAVEVTGAFAEAATDAAPVDPLPPLEAAFATAVSTFYFRDRGREVGAQLGRLLEALSAVFGNPLALPPRFPTPNNLRARRRYRAVRRIVDACVTERLDGAPRRGTTPDLATDVALEASAAGYGVARISDLLIGSLLAAIRVPAAGAAWTLRQLAHQPHLLPDVSDGELVCHIMETLRLYPPTWLMQRTAVRAVRLGGYEFAAGHHFMISPYVIHRDQTLFDDPERYLPERWSSRSVPGMLAFGRGIHRCPGQDAGVAMILAAVKAVRRGYSLTVPEDVRVVADPRSTLVPAGLRLSLERRVVPLISR